MPATTNFQVIGLGQRQKEAISAAVADKMARVPGKWRVQLIGGREDEVWELRVSGPGVETSNYLGRSAGEQTADSIAAAVATVASEHGGFQFKTPASQD